VAAGRDFRVPPRPGAGCVGHGFASPIGSAPISAAGKEQLAHLRAKLAGAPDAVAAFEGLVGAKVAADGKRVTATAQIPLPTPAGWTALLLLSVD